MDIVIETQGLTKYYGKVQGVENLNLTVRRGEIFGFLGPNGAGKTTTIRLLLDFIRPTRGWARVFGLDSHKSTTLIKSRVGNLPGEFGLYEGLTGREFLRYMASLRNGVDHTYVEELIKRLDLDVDRRIKGYSRGMKQKVGMVQALMHRPELLILDEPTSGLDPLMQQEVHRLLKEAQAEGRTVFFSSHILPEVEQLADRVGIIREGALAAVEEVAELRRKSFRRMEITFRSPVPLSDFQLPGVREVSAAGPRLHLVVQDNLDGVIKAAARYPVVDLEYHRASLEEIFLTYYAGGSNAR